MIRRFETDPVDHDERLGEAIEAFLGLVEGGAAPDPEGFAARYPDLGDDLRAALEGLALVRGLVGEPSGPGHRLEAGRRIAGYRIVRELGRGGMGIVYEAVHVDLDRPVALKVLGIHAAPDSTGRRRFLNEARTAAGLHHTHIVPVFDVGQVGGLCYYAMQRIEGSGLDHVLRALRRDRTVAAGSGGSATLRATPSLVGLCEKDENAPSRQDETATWIGGGSQVAISRPGGPRGVPEDEPPPFVPPLGSAYYRWVASVGRQAAEALGHAHHRGIIHRDIKPSNLLVDARGTVWVADFGLARRLADPSLTQSDSLLGTPRYMSPEQADNGLIDGRTDIYSLGATLYELLTLRPPFDGRTASELSKQIATREPAAPRQSDPRIPRDLETIVLKAMAKRPSDRYATSSDLAEDLARFLGHEPVRARRIGPLGRLWRFTQRHPSITAVSVAAAVTVLAVATIAYVRVVRARDLAVQARNEAQEATRGAQAANLKTQSLMREQLLSQASITRQAAVPKRRATGLKLLKQAVELSPEPALTLKLRNEALEFFALRDVEKRPEIPVGKTRALLFGPDGTSLASLSEEDSEFRIWDLNRGVLRASSVKAGPNPAPFSPDGNRIQWGNVPMAVVGHHLAVVWPDGKGFRLFETATGAQFADVSMPNREVIGLYAASGAAQRLVTLERTPFRREENGRHVFNYRVNLWDYSGGDEPMLTLIDSARDTSTTNRPPLVAISPDGETIATASFAGKDVTLWSAKDGKQRGDKIDTQSNLWALALGPDGVLATAGSGSIRLWEVASQPPVALHSLSPQQSMVRMLRFSPDGTILAVAGTESGIELWDPASNSLMATLPTSERVNDMVFAPVGRTLAVGQTSSIAIWAVNEPKGLVRFSGFKDAPTSLAFGPNGPLVMASRTGSLRFWCPDLCPTTIHDWDQVASPAVVFDSEGRLGALDADALHWYRPPARECVQKVDLPHSQGPSYPRRPSSPRQPLPMAVARAADGQTLVVTRGSEVLLVAGTPAIVRRLTPPESPEPTLPQGSRQRGKPPGPPWREVAVSPAGDRVYLTTFGGDALSIWSLEGDVVRPLDWSGIPRKDVTSLAVSPDGGLLALGGREGVVVLVDTVRETVKTRLTPPSQEDEGDVRSLAFSPLGDELAVGTQRGTIRLWKVGDVFTPLVRLPGHRGTVSTLAYDAGARRLASGSQDKTVVVWDLKLVRDELAKLGLDWSSPGSYKP